MTPPPGPEELDGLAALARRFAATELCARLGRAREVRREQRFAFGLAGGVPVVGVLDVLAWETEPGQPTTALVVDYKTDRLSGDTPAAIVARAYAGQRLIYALAALRAGAPRVEVVHCFLEAPESPVTATYARDDADELAAQLHARAEGVLARRFEVAPDPHRRLCAGCPAQGGLCSWPTEMTRRESPDTLF